MNSKAVTFVSMDLIANKIMKHPLMKSLNYEDIIDHAVTVLKLIKAPGIYKEDSCVKTIENHLAAIPKQSLNIISVEYIDDAGNQTPMVVNTNTLAKQFHKLDTRMAYAKNIVQSGDYSPEIYSDPAVSKIQREQLVAVVVPEPVRNVFKYQVNNQRIVCSMASGRVMITFEMINADENGIPLIPNSESVIKAITSYIKTQVFEVLVDMNQLSERSLTRAEQDYCWYIGQAQTEFQGIGSVDEMEAFINSHVGLFNVSSLHSDRYESSSDKEVINIL